MQAMFGMIVCALQFNKSIVGWINYIEQIWKRINSCMLSHAVVGFHQLERSLNFAQWTTSFYKVCFDFVLPVRSAKPKTEMISLFLGNCKLLSLNYRDRNGVARVFRHFEKGANLVWNIVFVWHFDVHFLRLALCQSPHLGRFVDKYPKGLRNNSRLTR